MARRRPDTAAVCTLPSPPPCPPTCRCYSQTETKVSYTQRDLLTYAVGIGCQELRHIYELDDDFEAFPTWVSTYWHHLRVIDICDHTGALRRVGAHFKCCWRAEWI